MVKGCPNCAKKDPASEPRMRIVRAGFFRRLSDCKRVQRFRCLECLKYFSNATFSPCFRQKKRQFNFRVLRELASSVSQRRTAFNLNLNRKTVARKLIFLAARVEWELDKMNRAQPK